MPTYTIQFFRQVPPDLCTTPVVIQTVRATLSLRSQTSEWISQFLVSSASHLWLFSTNYSVVLLPVTPPWSHLGSAAAVAAAVNRRPTYRSRYLPTPTARICYRPSVCLSVRPSVCPSLRRVIIEKRLKLGVWNFHRPIPLVFAG